MNGSTKFGTQKVPDASSSSDGVKGVVSEEDEHELDAEDFEDDTNNIGSYRLENTPPPKAQPA